MTTTEFTTPADTDLVALRRFAAPAEAVWAAYVEPDRVRRWLAQPHSPMIACEVDLQVEGRYRYAWSMPDGTAFGFVGLYLEIDAPHRLVSTEVFQPDVPTDGSASPTSEHPVEAAVNTLELTQEGGATTLSLTMRYPSRASRDAAMATGMTDGMAACFDALEALLREDDDT